jgi:hypothetical protein
VDILKDFVRRGMAAKNAADEAIIRHLLSQWVSELEPAVARDKQRNIIGLCDANAPLGSKPFILRI